MPHYVRFLKPPTIEKAGAGSRIKTLVTVTTDLGDSFLAEQVQLTASVLVNSYNDSDVQCIQQKSFCWPAGAREVTVTIDGIRLNLRQHAVQLRVGPAAVHLRPDNDFATTSNIPAVISAWSPPFGGSGPPQAEKLVLRRLETRCPTEVRIWEETGNNLARHIWDASLAWLMLFQETLTPVDEPATSSFLTFRDLLVQKNGESRFNVIELGAGCGIVGIALAQFMTDCSVLLTDLEEVRDIVNRNIGVSKPAAGSVVEFQVLDWDGAVPRQISEQQHDLVVVSDCTYNSDSLPALVGTMAALVDRSPQAAIIVALKRRHESESVFFELMQSARLEVHDKTRIQLPSVCSEDDVESVDIEVYYFRLLPSVHDDMPIPLLRPRQAA
ncbi:uncharacterized protein GIQ15_06200 [Arthroderma uncinatum]|uniref:uncharacterized protein n=1 Tax=Arthroderma uncinatum TaxID=74035 RepID=UPI00144AB273|nr:uncharacterized protein GIQ15_06200 [Arthroderma uncinatum]KAF3480853.1 hypothetical protein GIQ15_06200 [Arthroderma uncinatum]